MLDTYSKKPRGASILRGASRIIDLGRAIPPYQIERRRFPTSRVNLQRDWEAVGRDLWNVTVNAGRDIEHSR